MLVNRRTFRIKRGKMDEAVQTVREMGAIQHPTNTAIRIYTPEFASFDTLVADFVCADRDEYQHFIDWLFSNQEMAPLLARWDECVAQGGTNELWNGIDIA